MATLAHLAARAAAAIAEAERLRSDVAAVLARSSALRAARRRRHGGGRIAHADIGDDPPPAPPNPAELSEAELFAMLVERAACRGAKLLVEHHPQTSEWTAAFIVDDVSLFRTQPERESRTVLERLLWTDTHAAG
jgi:hypothetical protein